MLRVELFMLKKFMLFGGCGSDVFGSDFFQKITCIFIVLLCQKILIRKNGDFYLLPIHYSLFTKNEDFLESNK